MNFRQQVQKAHRQTDIYRLELLQKARAKWSRRATIAESKLTEIREDIEALCKKLAKEKADAGLKANEHYGKAIQ